MSRLMKNARIAVAALFIATSVGSVFASASPIDDDGGLLEAGNCKKEIIFHTPFGDLTCKLIKETEDSCEYDCGGAE